MTAGADGATPTRGRLGAGVAGFAEALCPLLLLAILLDATSRVEWVFLQRDPAIYASIARYWEAGLMPYRDVWEFKPPLIFVALRAGFALWGHEPESLRRVFLILTWIGSLALYLGLRRARCLIAAPVAALGLMTLVVVNPWELPWQNTEPLVAAFAAAAIGCATAHQRDARWWWALLTGACLGLAVTGKQPAALFAVPLGLQLCLWGAPDGWRGRVTYVGHRALLGLGGFALALAPFALYFALHDALRALYDAVLVDGAAYSQSVGLSWIRPSVLALRTPPGVRNLFAARPAFPFVALGLMWPFVAAIGGLAVLTLLRPSRWVLVAWAWLVAAAFAVWIGPFAENHYLVMTLPALALTAGIVAEQCWPTARAFGWRTRTVRLLAGILIAALLYGAAWRDLYWPRRAHAPGGEPTEQEARRLGEAIRDAAQPGDRLFVGDEPLQIYFYAGVPPASRFIYWNAPNPNAIAERAAAVERVPTFFFLPRAAEAQRAAMRAEHPDAPDLLAQRYEPWLTSPVGTVYRRRDGGQAVTGARPGS